MASFCRTALMAGFRNLVSRSKPVTLKSLHLKTHNDFISFSFGTFTVPIHPSPFKDSLDFGSVETMVPLHSAVASARLRLSIAADSSYWSCLSLGLQCCCKRPILLLKQEKDNKCPYTFLGLAFASLGDYKKAEEAHLKSIQLDSNYLEAWLHLAQALK